MLQTMWKATMLYQKINMTASLQWMEVFIFLNFHPPCSAFFGAWLILKFFGAWSLLKFFWSMVIFQILLEHGYFLSKALGSGQSGPKIKSLPGGWKFKKMNTSIYCRFLEPNKRVPPWFEKSVWRNTIIFVFWWSMVPSQIFDGAWSLLKFCGAWSLLFGAWLLLKFFWSMVIQENEYFHSWQIFRT